MIAAGIWHEFNVVVRQDVPSGELGAHIAECLEKDPDTAFKAACLRVFKWKHGVLHSGSPGK